FLEDYRDPELHIGFRLRGIDRRSFRELDRQEGAGRSAPPPSGKPMDFPRGVPHADGGQEKGAARPDLEPPSLLLAGGPTAFDPGQQGRGEPVRLAAFALANPLGLKPASFAGRLNRQRRLAALAVLIRLIDLAAVG